MMRASLSRHRHERGAARAALLWTAIFASALAACGGCSRPAPPAEDAARPIPVEVLVVEPRAMNDETSLSGILEAHRGVEIVSEVGGPLESVHRDVGDEVRKGAILARVEQRVAREGLNQAEAGVLAAEARYAVAHEDHLRDSTLFASGDIAVALYESTRMAWQATRAELLAARASRELARRQLEKTEIRAPFSGRVARRDVQAGAFVSPGMPLFRIVAIDSLRLVLGLAQSHLARARPGLDVRVTSEAFAGQVFHGRVRAVGPAADPLSRTFPVEVLLPNPPGHPLRDGLVVRAALVLESLTGAIAIPREAVLRQGDQDFVWVVRDSVAAPQPIRTRCMLEDRYLIDEGLAPGEAVVISGMHGLREGARVRVEPAAPAPGGGEGG